MAKDGEEPKVRTVGPITHTRLNPLPQRRPTPSKTDDEMRVAIAERNAKIDRLLRDEFGTLAPPPPPNLFDTPSDRTQLARARLRYEDVESRRRELEAMDAADLQACIDEADTKLRNAALEDAAKMHAWRALQWPIWAAQDLWSEAEFAAMCCGLIPNEGRSDARVGLVNQARETISRGVLSQSLTFVARTDADSGAKLYGTARHFVPTVAVEWARTRFSAFPEGLLAAVRARAARPATTSALDLSQYPGELSAAIEAFNAVRGHAQALAGKTPKAAISAWLEVNKPNLTSNARERIATVANWQPTGGAPKTPGG